MKRILMFLLIVTLGFVLVSCGKDKEETPKQDDNVVAPTPENGGNTDNGGTDQPSIPTVKPNDVIKNRPDTREDAYGIYSASGELIESHKSLYAAIVSCVDNCDLDDYVAELGSSEALFVNYRQFDESTKDMFWYYKEGTVKDRYVPWLSGYWNEDAINKDQICVYKNYATQQLQPYANGYILASQGSADAASTQVWNSCWYLEASATVNLISYSGITKATYDIDLSEAKVYPSYEGSDQTWAYVGFITADSYNVSHQGLRCDTTTGNWYYYSGEVTHESEDIEIDKSKCVLTSTWDDVEKCFKPDADVKMTMELLTIDDEFIVHRLTVELSNGTKFVKDYEISKLTMCGTIRFTCGLDIVSDNTFPDYMNGGKFENVVVTSAKGYVLPEIADGDVDYGNIVGLNAGTYDLLNSNPASAARLHTLIYTPACSKYDFNTAGKDVYSFSYDF